MSPKLKYLSYPQTISDQVHVSGNRVRIFISGCGEDLPSGSGALGRKSGAAFVGKIPGASLVANTSAVGVP